MRPNVRYTYQFLFRILQGNLQIEERCEIIAGLHVFVSIRLRTLRCKGSVGFSQGCCDLLSQWSLLLQLAENVFELAVIQLVVLLRRGRVGHVQVVGRVIRGEVDVGRPLDQKTRHLYLVL